MLSVCAKHPSAQIFSEMATARNTTSESAEGLVVKSLAKASSFVPPMEASYQGTSSFVLPTEASYQGASSFVPPMEASYQGTSSFVPPLTPKLDRALAPVGP
jgi:hypothetical protein